MKRNIKYTVEKKRAPRNIRLDPSSVLQEIIFFKGLIQNGIKGVVLSGQDLTSTKLLTHERN